MRSERMSEIERYKKANPWILVNIQNAQAFSGRYPTREAAEQAAKERGGVVDVRGFQVFFSEMPNL